MWKKTFRSRSLGIKREGEDGKIQSDTEKQKGRDRLKEKHNKRNNFHTFVSKNHKLEETIDPIKNYNTHIQINRVNAFIFW